MISRIRRRDFLRTAGTAGAGFWIAGRRVGFGQETSPNAKLNIACVGLGGQGGSNLKNVAGQTIVALCDVDSNPLGKAGTPFPDAKRYVDVRKMFDEMAPKIDAVVVSTPDQHHAHASVMAMNLGKSVYCEKPLTHSVHEARVMAETAARMKVTTTMGQGYSGDSLPGLVAAIGEVREVHCWSNRPIWPQGIDRPADGPKAPAHLDWDLWLGPAPERPYHPAYHPFKWRGWWDFGTGALGDMACHIMDAAFRGLKLGPPSTIEAEGEPRHLETAPKWGTVRYEFPRGEKAPLKLTWSDGGKKPDAALVGGAELKEGGWIMVGERGTLWDGRLLPAEKFTGFKAPPVEKKYPGRHKEWIDACREKRSTTNGFDYAAPMTEAILLGNVAFRVGRKIEWDAAAMKAKGCPEADPFIRREYRKGWSL